MKVIREILNHFEVLIKQSEFLFDSPDRKISHNFDPQIKL